MSKFMSCALLALAVVATGSTFAADFGPGEFIDTVSRSSSIESLLRNLPIEMRESYTLQHTGTPNAAQGCTAENPRAILFNSTGDLVLTFNDHPTLPGYDTVEALTFNAKSGNFDLFLVKYGSDHAAQITRNPTQCLGCHGQNPHPVWNSYGHWDHFFGSDPDLVDYPAKTEIDALKAFNAKLGDRSARVRYQILEPRLASTLPITPYTGTHFDPAKNPLTTDFYFSPNFRLGMFLYRDSSIAFARKIEAHPLAKDLLPLAFYAANCSAADGESKADQWKSNAKTFVLPERGPFIAKFPELATKYDSAKLNIATILSTGDAKSADTQKFFNFMGINPRRLVLAQHDLDNGALDSLFFLDGLSEHVTKTMAFYPGELLNDLKAAYPLEAIPFTLGRNEKIYHWTTSPQIMDALDRITMHALGTAADCASLWPLIIRTAGNDSVTQYLSGGSQGGKLPPGQDPGSSTPQGGDERPLTSAEMHRRFAEARRNLAHPTTPVFQDPRIHVRGRRRAGPR